MNTWKRFIILNTFLFKLLFIKRSQTITGYLPCAQNEAEKYSILNSRSDFMEKRIVIKDVCLRKSPINRPLSTCSMHQMMVEIEDDEYGNITDDNQSLLG